MAAALKPAPNLTVYRGFPARGCYVASPFVSKLEARLRIGGVAYRVDCGSPFKGPRKKIPYIEIDRAAAHDTNDAAAAAPDMLSDSTLIARRLVEERYMEDLNAVLTPLERAQDLAVRALLEDKLYFYQVRERWVDNYYTMRDTVLGFMPYPIRVLVGLIAFRSVKATLNGQGALRFTGDEAAAARREVWESINAMLVEARSKAQAAGAKGPFWVLGGATPTEADPTVFGFVTAALGCKQAPASEELVRSFPVVMEYARRIHDQYFSDYELWQE
ncbi:hypothetical protein C8A00DRAFT_19553 [Chaetomidium leptoderma]|uniref:Thioredoxin-like fold domain-containing protein n=1 Tax=Chaetomidium leptoderma TaxID=669021 RepID=A0AAN6VC26_9PEZI|nr:hypothetical protein C8A00DRAFT_19553 [Chaetomidium leptoderma]